MSIFLLVVIRFGHQNDVNSIELSSLLIGMSGRLIRPSLGIKIGRIMCRCPIFFISNWNREIRLSISLSIMNLKRRNWAGNPSKGRHKKDSTSRMNLNVKRRVVNDGTRTPLTCKLDFEVWLHKPNSFLMLWSNEIPAWPVFRNCFLAIPRFNYYVIPSFRSKASVFFVFIPMVTS